MDQYAVTCHGAVDCMITKYIVGDITKTELKYIAHGVNAQNKMGSGVAKALYEKFPEVKKEYHLHCVLWSYEKQELLLGQVCPVFINDKNIFNLFTQLNYGYDGKRYVNYASIVTCFRTLSNLIPEGEILAIPKIGCGLAGGDWNIVEQLINDTVGDDLEIWVYELEDSQKRDGRNGDLG